MTVKVLVLDRNHVIEQQLKECLGNFDCQIITATSTALALFLARKNFPALLVARIDSDNDFADIADELKVDPDLAAIPVVFVSAPGQPGNHAVEKHIHTPISSVGLFAELRPYLVDLPDEREAETPE